MRYLALAGVCVALAGCVSPAERAARLEAQMAEDRSIETIRQGCERMAPGSTELLLCLMIYNNVLQARADWQARQDQAVAAARASFAQGVKDAGKAYEYVPPPMQPRPTICKPVPYSDQYSQTGQSSYSCQ